MVRAGSRSWLAGGIEKKKKVAELKVTEGEGTAGGTQ